MCAPSRWSTSLPWFVSTTQPSIFLCITPKVMSDSQSCFTIADYLCSGMGSAARLSSVLRRVIDSDTVPSCLPYIFAQRPPSPLRLYAPATAPNPAAHHPRLLGTEHDGRICACLNHQKASRKPQREKKLLSGGKLKS